MKSVSQFIYSFAGFISVQIWGRLSRSMQFAISALIARLYNTRLSAFLIRPYCLWHYGNPDYHQGFLPGNGAQHFKTFQEFFTRDFIELPEINSGAIWPCEGYLCESGQTEALSTVKVKGEEREIPSIFGRKIPGESFFSNVFLHNNNYHHIHAPVSGKILRIVRIPGELLLLRPWAYKNNPSLPALTNERVNVDILDRKGREWLLSIVGGPLVATIRLPEYLRINAPIEIGQKIATFELGSTCCMVSPIAPENSVGSRIQMGAPFEQ
ncbi:MAG TPA: phosphatidylserine decarboxylase [Nitrospiria bacterium]|nr:phosphatidylserine decarboxylase [Candidatus Manganitrophaceae bacterium]HIL33989.1 phosphatidylserine decarboxylase [Candidatus Manganitrophaceae bacterium]